MRAGWGPCWAWFCCETESLPAAHPTVVWLRQALQCLHLTHVRPAWPAHPQWMLFEEAAGRFRGPGPI